MQPGTLVTFKCVVPYYVNSNRAVMVPGRDVYIIVERKDHERDGSLVDILTDHGIFTITNTFLQPVHIA